MLHPDHSPAVRRLNDLRATLPADHTLRNLIGVLSAKLELCSKLPIYEYEAANAGDVDSAAAFRRLAETERVSFDDILGTLRQHLETARAAKESVVAEGVDA